MKDDWKNNQANNTPRILLCAVSKKENYIEAVKTLGAIPVLKYQAEELERYDGLILCGGNDINPRYYGEKLSGAVDIDYERDEAEAFIAKAFIEAGKPVMGICRGCQLINVLFGGSLYQHLDTTENHRESSGEDAIHLVTAEKGSSIFALYGEEFAVNSYHHQAVKKPGRDLHITARAKDGVVEAFEHIKLPIIGVQWHPERMCFSNKRSDTVDGSKIIKYFIEEMIGKA